MSKRPARDKRKPGVLPGPPDEQPASLKAEFEPEDWARFQSLVRLAAQMKQPPTQAEKPATRKPRKG